MHLIALLEPKSFIQVALYSPKTLADSSLPAIVLEL